LFKCLDPALTIAATLNSKSPFVAPFGREQEADTIKQSFKKGWSYRDKHDDSSAYIPSCPIGNSDFLTIANVFTIWRRMSDNPNSARVFCRRNFLSQQVWVLTVADYYAYTHGYLSFLPQTLQQIEELRQQLYSYLVDTNFVRITPAEKEAIAR
jgi:ATP-dependent RNA helicase DHX29